MGEWLRAEIHASMLLVVRPGDAVLLVEPGCTADAAELRVRARLPIAVEAVNRERKSGQSAVLNCRERLERFRESSDAICVFAIWAPNSALIVDRRCAAKDAEQLVLECVADLCAAIGANKKYKGARLELAGAAE